MHWHLNEADEVLSSLGSSFEGISSKEAEERLVRYGPNELKEKKKRTTFMMFLDQFKDFMIIILIIAAIISGVIGDATDTIVIFIIVILNAVIGFIQEYRAERAMAALKKMSAPSAVTMRDGKTVTVPARLLVPGDIVLLSAGQVIPADMRLFDAAMLRVEEAALTGESVPVEKHTDTLSEKDLPIGDRVNLAYNGTFVANGRGRGVVVATGMETELGKIAAMLQEEEAVRTPLQKRLENFGKKLALSVLLICAVVFALGVFRGEGTLLMLLTAISLAVAAIPEALPAVVTISLALGARKLVLQNALIRRLPAVETLGSVTYICSDKTGTLTMNKMTVEELYIDSHLIKGKDVAFRKIPEMAPSSPEYSLMVSMALSNDAHTGEGGGGVIGDPTEVALYNLTADNGFDKTELEKDFSRVGEIPFDSERKCMTTFHKGLVPGSNFSSITKGAIEVVTEKAHSILTSEGVRPLKSDELHRINDRMAADGLRVLCIALRHWDEVPDVLDTENVEKDLTIIGLVGIMDPPREEAARAIEVCRTAGIKPVMITGDHPITARAIAKRLGLLDEDSREVMTGRELQKLPVEEFIEEVEHISVYARVAPEQKLKIVKALQERGHYVAMTGDGVNDAPALKRADIGIAMGITGTDVSKEAADMVLLNDNFSTIVGAVKEGRRIFDNIRKFIKYTMTSNSGEILTIFLAPFFGLPIPLLPIHILWINLVTDGLPGLALAVEPKERGIMKRPPRHPKESVFSHGLGIHIVWVGSLMGAVCIFTQEWAMSENGAHWQTMVFTVLALSQMGHVLAIRFEQDSLFSKGFFTNKFLWGAVALTFILQMATIYVPFLQPIFKTEALSLG